MNKINKTKITYSIVYGFILLAILAFGIILTTKQAAAVGYYGGTSIDNSYQELNLGPINNPKPVINTISPNSSGVGIGAKTVNIIGEGFVPSSVARVNGSNRPTTFIDSSHLLVRITGDDTFIYRTNGGFFITVWNSAPGGGYSNAAFFVVSDSPVGENANDTSTNFTDLNQNENDTINKNSSDLASNAIFGLDGIIPSSLIQWIVFAILILLIVILVRKIYGGGEKYHATPMKHD